MHSKIFCVVFVATLVGSTIALPKQDNSEKDLLNMIEKMDNVPSLPLFGGLRIDRVENGRSFGSSKAVESFDERAERYLETHQLNFSFPDDDEEEDDFNGRSMEGERIISQVSRNGNNIIAVKTKVNNFKISNARK